MLPRAISTLIVAALVFPAALAGKEFELDAGAKARDARRLQAPSAANGVQITGLNVSIVNVSVLYGNGLISAQLF